MLKLLKYLLSGGIATVGVKDKFPQPDSEWRGIPGLTDAACEQGCDKCAALCPTEAITIFSENRNDQGNSEKQGNPEKRESQSDRKADIAIDLGACIQCGLCFEECPTGTIVENKTYQVATTSRADLVLSSNPDRVALVVEKANQPPRKEPLPLPSGQEKMFSQSLHARVVSTGCSACDAEIGASGNPVFDLERFGVHIVASPRYADALFVTGPVGKGMQEPLERCYEAMADPRIVVAIGTCAITGGMHKGGYAQANGADAILPVNLYIPGCPPHPWSIVHGVRVAMGKMEPFKPHITPSAQASVSK